MARVAMKHSSYTQSRSSRGSSRKEIILQNGRNIVCTCYQNEWTIILYRYQDPTKPRATRLGAERCVPGIGILEFEEMGQYYLNL